MIRRALWTWAARDAMRRPAASLLMGAAIAIFIALFGASLLATTSLVETTEAALARSPHVVARHVGPGGWAPLPAEATAAASAVRGVVRAQPRLWGVARWGEAAVTVVGDDAVARGECAVGGLFPEAPGEPLALEAARPLSLRVARRLDPEAGLVAHDLVLVHPDDARALLGLDPGQWSDLAVWVNHDSEMDAIRPDLAAALPFTARLTTRAEALGAARATIEAAAGRRTLLWAPALLGLLLLTLATARVEQHGRRDVALLKSLGWDTAEIVQLSLLRALIIALPAIALGQAAAWALVFVADLGWATRWLFGWTSAAPPALHLTPDGALLTLLEVTGLVLAPWLAAVLLPALRSATADPARWLTDQGTP